MEENKKIKRQVKISSIGVLIFSIISVAVAISFIVEYFMSPPLHLLSFVGLLLSYHFILMFSVISLAISFAFFITAFFDYKRNKNVTRKIELILTSIAMGLSSSAFLLLHVIFIF